MTTQSGVGSTFQAHVVISAGAAASVPAAQQESSQPEAQEGAQAGDWASAEGAADGADAEEAAEEVEAPVRGRSGVQRQSCRDSKRSTSRGRNTASLTCTATQMPCKQIRTRPLLLDPCDPTTLL